MMFKNVYPVKSGNSYYFTIPKQLIDHGLIDVNNSYDLDVEETKKKGDSNVKRKSINKRSGPIHSKR